MDDSGQTGERRKNRFLLPCLPISCQVDSQNFPPVWFCRCASPAPPFRSRPMTYSSRLHASRIRRGNTTLLVVCALVALVAIGGVVYWTMFRGDKATATGPILNTVAKGPYEVFVLEQGEVEPASAIELRCEVKSRGGGSGGGASTTIID